MLTGVGANQAGNYTVTASNSYGSASSAAAVVTVQTLAQIVNLSTIDLAGGGASPLAAGFSLSGNASVSKQLLIRGIGPALVNFGIGNPLGAPQLTLFNSKSTTIATNTGWGNDPLLVQAFIATGAFGLTANSADSALLSTLSAGTTYTAQVTSADGSSGTALVEIYDDSPGTSGSHLINVSSEDYVTPAAQLTAGFALSGNTAMTVVIRGIGPGLSGFGVPGALANTTLKVFDRNSNLIYSNTGWGENAALVTAFAKVGAFPLGANSGDSALLITLSPGNYSAQVSSADGSSGVALVEVYELQ
jgi:hypothetical protein